MQTHRLHAQTPAGDHRGVMRSLLIVAEADAAAFASGADAVLADTAAALGQGPPLYLRVRPLDEPGAWEQVQAAARLRPAGVALMRAEGAADVQRLGAWLAVEEARQGLPDGTLRILAFATQTPTAVLASPSYRGASQRLAGLIVTDAPTLRGGPLRLARDLAVIAAQAAGVPAIDATFGDPESLKQARADGFDGKAARTAAEVAVINAAFAP
jgi:citrate lyase subunit beta/citryl-CoA lyase